MGVCVESESGFQLSEIRIVLNIMYVNLASSLAHCKRGMMHYYEP